MPAFLLEPLNPEDPAWKSAKHAGWVRVFAETEKRARELAEITFSNLDLDEAPEHRLWTDPRMVTVERPLSAPRRQDGVVEIPDPDRPLPNVFEDIHWREVANVTEVTAERVVERVIERKLPYRAEAMSVLRFLIEKDAAGRPGSNEPPVQQLWLAADASEDQELKELLGELRDELRKLVQILEKQELEHEEVEEVTTAVGSTGRTFLDRFASTTGTATGNLLCGALGTLLVNLGWLDYSAFLLMVGAKGAEAVARASQKP